MCEQGRGTKALVTDTWKTAAYLTASKALTRRQIVHVRRCARRGSGSWRRGRARVEGGLEATRVEGGLEGV